MTDRETEFRKELAKLMRKHDATLEGDRSGDPISVRLWNHHFSWTDHFTLGWEVDANDVYRELDNNDN